ncbi:MAG: transglutaminase family protein [Geminicoccaceae bacterium]
MIYEVSHRTTYTYSVPVSISHHLLHLTPRNCLHQNCGEAALEVTPAPTVRDQDRDYFGNPVTFLTVQQPHRELLLHTLSIVDVHHRPVPELHATATWEAVRDRVALAADSDDLEALEFTFASEAAPFLAEAADYAAPSFPPGRPFLAGARDLISRIHREFRYDTKATDVATTVAEALAMRRGVCQDFAHVGLSCLRSLGLPARYVSGYLLTRPADGKEKLIGADASHAWLAVYVPEVGWVDLDPTNDLVVSDEHITLAWGRDYADVSPVSGVMFGGGEHRVAVAVDVTAIGPR